ncbi:TonB family protein / TonB-dependent receptor [Enhygromyxa salina]|uniref:TonB family protein / TonB-dependent receptor n=1 Tax=Enhygromyxa salina TaxID=215803 RepID=A0A0C1Z8D9_9BACT|nr:TonB-dependent receptor [Enhygromyxa salina]KIG13899.1 TonB family protein / TonB-dependent receptor [Enhygromyxa salina]
MTARARRLFGLGLAGLTWVTAPLPLAQAAPPPHATPEPEPEPELLVLRGRVREAGGSRAGVSAAVVLVVDASEDQEFRPDKPPRGELDPDSVTWMRRAETDEAGNFVITEIPATKIRIVIIAGGYTRLELWAELDPEQDPRERALYLRPEQGGAYRTEVRTDRQARYAVAPEHVLDAQQARSYAGSGDDPLLAAQNLPGIVRSPGGLGMLGFRGGDPNQAGVYLDGHPVPRAFHVLPLASVIPAPMAARVKLSPGNYAAAYGSFGGGLVEIESRPGGREGIHGQAHLDLFDFGTTLEGPVGPGSVHLGVRRSHVGDILRLASVDPDVVGSPNYWDYLGRFDYPLAPGHEITVRALGAGDTLQGGEYFKFSAGFHRFDLEYRRTSELWAISISPSLRLDKSRIEQGFGPLERIAQVYSLRATATRKTRFDWLSLEFGADLVAERWQRRSISAPFYIIVDGTPMSLGEPVERLHDGSQLRFGAWVGLPFRFDRFSLVPAVRANLFAYSGYPNVRLDPRLDLSVRAHDRVQLHAALGMYSTPVVLGSSRDTDLIQQGGSLGEGNADVPTYLIAYFEPNIETDTEGRSSTATYVIHAASGVHLLLPWELEARATLFWREGLPVTLERLVAEPYEYARRRAYGLELLVRRSLANDIVDGWLGYTLMSSRIDQPERGWEPAVFDQRHNFVALLGVNLPRGFRFGARFRLVSGNPETPVVGRQIFASGTGDWDYFPLRAPRGTSYQPLFHQLDLRLDKRWVKDRVSVTAYLDVQNVYNRIYPEVWIYTRDWAERRSLIGLPVYPSLGVQVDF